jgi:hypothetical protein
MSQETDAVATAVSDEAEVMASVERGGRDTFIIADISRDDAFVTAPLEDAASLPEWR